MGEETNREMAPSPLEIIGYGTGSATLQDVRKAVTACWNDIKADPARLQAAAAALGISVAQLRDNPRSPVQLQTRQSGTGTVEIAIVVVSYIGTDIVWGAVRDLAKDEIKRRIKQLWSTVLEPAVRRHLRERDALGPTKELPPG